MAFVRRAREGIGVLSRAAGEPADRLVGPMGDTGSDGDGGISTAVTKTVNVVAKNDAPVIGSWDTTVTYTENAVPLLLDTTATVVDVDSLNLATGKLTVAISANSQTRDRIGIRHQGAAAGQIGVSGLTLSYGGIALGTFAGAFTTAKIAANHKMKFALGVGIVFLAGGITNVFMLPSPIWFTVIDLVGAYIPMGYLAGKSALK